MRLLIALALWAGASVPLGLLTGCLLRRLDRPPTVADEAEEYLRDRVAPGCPHPGRVGARSERHTL